MNPFERKIFRDENPLRAVAQLKGKLAALEIMLAQKDAQIAALVRSMEEIKAMTHCDALGDRYTRVRQVAAVAIKEATKCHTRP